MLTLGSAVTHLKLTGSNETLNLDNLALETGAGSLTIAGALKLQNGAELNSSGGTITLESENSDYFVESGSLFSIPNTALVTNNYLSFFGSTLKAKNTTFTTNGFSLALDTGSILEVEGTQNITGFAFGWLKYTSISRGY